MHSPSSASSEAFSVNAFHSTIKFTAEMSETEITFLDTKEYKGARFDEESILDVQTHLQTNRNIPVRELLLVSPTKREKKKASSKGKRSGF